jgi:hypothetical protein
MRQREYAELHKDDAADGETAVDESESVSHEETFGIEVVEEFVPEANPVEVAPGIELAYEQAKDESTHESKGDPADTDKSVEDLQAMLSGLMKAS